MSQNPNIKAQLEHIGFTIQYRDELTAALQYLELLAGPPSRYMLGVPTYGRHAALAEPFVENRLGSWPA